MLLRDATQRERFEHPAWILAWIAVGGLALFFVVPPLIRAIGQAVGVVVTSFGLAIGLGAGSVGLAGAVAPWVLPAASGGLAALGATAVVGLGAKAVEKARQEPFKWIAPILGILTTFVVNLVKELFPAPGVPRVAIAATVGALVVCAGILWKQPGKSTKVLASALVIVPPALALYESADWSLGFASAIAAISSATWLSLALLIPVLLLTLILAAITK